MNCPKCGEEMVPWIRWGRDTGNLVCPTCWYKCTPQGERILAKKKVTYREAMKFIQRRRT